MDNIKNDEYFVEKILIDLHFISKHMDGVRVTRIIRTSPRAIIFGAFGIVVLVKLIFCVVLRTQNHLKLKALGSEIFWLTNIRQQQENADDSILIHSRRLTN